MADEIDVANALVEGAVDRALRQIRMQTSMQQASGVKACVECGDDIPVERQKFGFFKNDFHIMILEKFF